MYVAQNVNNKHQQNNNEAMRTNNRHVTVEQMNRTKCEQQNNGNNVEWYSNRKVEIERTGEQ
jgi:hypothetical protein